MNPQMAVSISLLLGISIQLFTAMVVAAPSQSTVSRREENAIKEYGGQVENDQPVALRLNLPQLLPIGIKYHFAKTWYVKGKEDVEGSFCNQEEIEIIHKCGIERLYNAIDGRLNDSKSMTSGEDFNKALDKLCGFYDQFTRCLQGYYLRDCLKDDKTIVDVLYGYICHPGKEALTSSYTGHCLSKLTTSSVVKSLQGQERCKDVFSDLSLSLPVLFAQLHDNSWDISDELPAMKEGLRILCRGWYLEETCIIPVYAKECGKTAKTFYLRLLNYIKRELAAEYISYGPDMGQLASCNNSVEKSLLNKSPKLQHPDAFRSYVINQYNTWEKADYIWETKYGNCHLRSYYYRMLKCFWRSVYEAGHDVLDLIANFKSHYKAISGLFVQFSHCYDDWLEECPPENRVSFVGLVQSLNRITPLTEKAVNCIDTLHISGSKCGMTFSDIIEYYFYHAARFFDMQISVCGSHLSVQGAADVSCITGESELTLADRCDSGIIDAVKDLTTNIETVISDYIAFVAKFQEQLCKLNSGSK